MTDINSISNRFEIPLTKGFVAIVDEVDIDLSSQKWCAHVSGKHMLHTYAKRDASIRGGGKKKAIFLHRIIAERFLGRSLLDNEKVDHINRNTLDNRRCNLRVASNSQNSANCLRVVPKTSKYRGVSWSKRRNKWLAQITFEMKHINLGCYETEEEAAEVYRNKALEFFGEFARFDVE